MRERDRSGKRLRCSFCGRGEPRAEVVVPGPRGSAICDECVERAQAAIARRRVRGGWAAQVAAVDRVFSEREPTFPSDAELLIDRAAALEMLSRETEAMESLDAALAILADQTSPELALQNARALLARIRLAEQLSADPGPIDEVARINVAVSRLPGDEMPAAAQWRSELLVEKALLLERAGQDVAVAAVVDEMVDRYAGGEDRHAATAAAWALRNRIAARLEAGEDDAALEDVERLRAVRSRAGVVEHVAAVWRLLLIAGHTDAAERFFTDRLDRDLEYVARELPVQTARSQLAALFEASRAGDQNATDAAALTLLWTLRRAPGSPELAELLHAWEAGAVDDAAAARAGDRSDL